MCFIMKRHRAASDIALVQWAAGRTTGTLADNPAMPLDPSPSLRLLAIETSTDALSVALGTGEPGADAHDGPRRGGGHQ